MDVYEREAAYLMSERLLTLEAGQCLRMEVRAAIIYSAGTQRVSRSGR